jgi:hypothetical protein
MFCNFTNIYNYDTAIKTLFLIILILSLLICLSIGFISIIFKRSFESYNTKLNIIKDLLLDLDLKFQNNFSNKEKIEEIEK